MKELHRVRVHILHVLRHTQEARFSELMKRSSLESDSFKFHIRALCEQGYLQKNARELYELTAPGKELANSLDEIRQKSLQLPRLSLFIICTRRSKDGAKEYLIQERLRQPFFGYFGCISGPAQRGIDFTETARKELQKQTGIVASDCRVLSFYRQYDYENSGMLLEDKLFVITEATFADTELSVWYGGNTQWMTLKTLRAQQKVFATSLHILSCLDEGRSIEWASGTSTYPHADY